MYKRQVTDRVGDVIQKLYIGMNKTKYVELGKPGYPFYILCVGSKRVHMILVGLAIEGEKAGVFSDESLPLLPRDFLIDGETIVASAFVQSGAKNEKTSLYLAVQNKTAKTHRLIIIDERYFNKLQEPEPEQPEQ